MGGARTDSKGGCISATSIDDDSEGKRIEKVAPQREDYYQALIEHSLDLITVVDARGRITFSSPSVERILGYAPPELHERSVFDLVWPDDGPRVMAAFERGRALQGPTPIIEFRMRHKNGDRRVVESVGRTVVGAGLDGMMIIHSRDITERRLLEEQFRQAQKMEALGRLTSSIAHDFNHFLTTMQGLTEQLMRAETTKPVRAELREMQKVLEMADALTRQLLSFIRDRPVRLDDVNVNLSIQDLSGILHRLVAPNVNLELAFDGSAALARMDKGLLDHVVVNLVINARDAMPDGGQLRIRTTIATLPDEVDGAAGGGLVEYVVIEFADTGAGMSPEAKNRIFEPFFRTKEPGKGTGLGLATVFRIVHEAGGYIEVDSTKGHGTTFRVYLRRA